MEKNSSLELGWKLRRAKDTRIPQSWARDRSWLWSRQYCGEKGNWGLPTAGKGRDRLDTAARGDSQVGKPLREFGGFIQVRGEALKWPSEGGEEQGDGLGRNWEETGEEQQGKGWECQQGPGQVGDGSLGSCPATGISQSGWGKAQGWTGMELG